MTERDQGGDGDVEELSLEQQEEIGEMLAALAESIHAATAQLRVRVDELQEINDLEAMYRL
jgi:hypothetical protein